MMAWLGTALKSSHPSRSGSCRSDSRIVLITGAAALSCAAGASGVTLPGYGVPVVVSSLDATAGHAPIKGANRPFCETIAIRPDAITENQNWPCRELNYHRTPNHQRPRSRFGECCDVAAQTAHASFRCYFATAWLTGGPSVLHWQAHLRRLSFASSPASARPVEKRCSSPSHDFQFTGANDEYFRKNHERDLRHQGGCRTRKRWCGRKPGIGRRIVFLRIGCAGAVSRRRAHPGQGRCRQKGKAGMAHLDRRSDEGARLRLQSRRAQGA